MKVAYFMPFSGVGGTEIGALRIIRAVRPHGFDPLAYCFYPAPDLNAYFSAAAVPVIDWAPPQPSLLQHGISFYRQSEHLAAELRRQGVGLVHCQDMLAAQHGALAGRLAGIPVLCHIRSRHDRVSRRDQVFLWPVDHFAFVSRSSWDKFSYPVKASRGTVLYDGVRTPDPASDPAAFREAFFAEFHIPDDAVLIGMTARVAPAKDYETLLQAAAQVLQSHPQALFLIVGDYSSDSAYQKYYEQIRVQARELGILDRFRFTGFRGDVNAILHLLDIFVFSTHFEGFPLSTLEAMACGKPVVATAVDGIPEQIEHGRSGLLTPPGDAAAMAQSLSDLIARPELAARISEGARQAVERRFSESFFADSCLQLYRRFEGARK